MDVIEESILKNVNKPIFLTKARNLALQIRQWNKNVKRFGTASLKPFQSIEYVKKWKRWK